VKKRVVGIEIFNIEALRAREKGWKIFTTQCTKKIHDEKNLARNFLSSHLSHLHHIFYFTYRRDDDDCSNYIIIVPTRRHILVNEFLPIMRPYGT